MLLVSYVYRCISSYQGGFLITVWSLARCPADTTKYNDNHRKPIAYSESALKIALETPSERFLRGFLTQMTQQLYLLFPSNGSLFSPWRNAGPGAPPGISTSDCVYGPKRRPACTQFFSFFRRPAGARHRYIPRKLEQRRIPAKNSEFQPKMPPPDISTQWELLPRRLRDRSSSLSH